MDYWDDDRRRDRFNRSTDYYYRGSRSPRYDHFGDEFNDHDDRDTWGDRGRAYTDYDYERGQRRARNTDVYGDREIDQRYERNRDWELDQRYASRRPTSDQGYRGTRRTDFEQGGRNAGTYGDRSISRGGESYGDRDFQDRGYYRDDRSSGYDDGRSSGGRRGTSYAQRGYYDSIGYGEYNDRDTGTSSRDDRSRQRGGWRQNQMRSQGDVERFSYERGDDWNEPWFDWERHDQQPQMNRDRYRSDQPMRQLNQNTMNRGGSTMRRSNQRSDDAIRFDYGRDDWNEPWFEWNDEMRHDRDRYGDTSRMDAYYRRNEQAQPMNRGQDTSRTSYGSGYNSEQSWNVGPYSGRGPEGYRRSDERILEDVCERLTHHGQIDATGVYVEVYNGEVTLQGTVADRRTKRMIADEVENMPSVQQVHNNLRVGQQATT